MKISYLSSALWKQWATKLPEVHINQAFPRTFGIFAIDFNGWTLVESKAFPDNIIGFADPSHGRLRLFRIDAGTEHFSSVTFEQLARMAEEVLALTPGPQQKPS